MIDKIAGRGNSLWELGPFGACPAYTICQTSPTYQSQPMKFATSILLCLVSVGAAGHVAPTSENAGLNDLFDAHGSARTLGTDFKCMNECSGSGHIYAFCQSQCSYPDNQAPPIQPAFGGHGTDYKCLTQCESSGYQFGYCKHKCGY
jgi:hypothetical protein